MGTLIATVDAGDGVDVGPNSSTVSVPGIGVIIPKSSGGNVPVGSAVMKVGVTFKVGATPTVLVTLGRGTAVHVSVKVGVGATAVSVWAKASAV